MSIRNTTITQLRQMADQEGLVLQGCGGSLQEWQDGINLLLTEEGILQGGTKFEDIRVFQNEGCTCLLFPFTPEIQLDMGKLAVWRIRSSEQFGGMWFSDYVDIKLGGYIQDHPIQQKPDCPLIGEDGNIFNLMGIASRTLKENGMAEQAREMRQRITQCHSYDSALCIIADYLITSTLPSITSASTYLSEYSFIDTLSKGITYLKNDVVLSFYTDAACKNLVATWTEADGKFAVSYNTTTAGESVMTISMTEKGLAEINTSKDVYSGANMVNSGYSDCTVKITYQAQMNSDASVIYGDAGNPNEVALVWRRTSSNYYDTLVDDAHVFTYGIELTKLFSDGQGNFDKVEFILFNETDGYYAIAELNEDEGIYYITGHTGNPENATRFIPIKGEDGKGKVFVKGIEDDSWVATELRTDDGYTLLKDDIKIVISQVKTADTCDIYTSDVLGLVQNDPRYATIINDTGDLRNMPQKHLEHHHLTASSTVDGNDVTMLEDSGSKNAHAPLSVVNTKGFDLPATGDYGVWMYGLAGILLMAGSITSIIIGCRKKSNKK